MKQLLLVGRLQLLRVWAFQIINYWSSFARCLVYPHLLIWVKINLPFHGSQGFSFEQRACVLGLPPPKPLDFVDASVVAEIGSGTIGVVVSDSMGIVVLSVQSFLPRCANVEVVELHACLAGFYIVVLCSNRLFWRLCLYVYQFLLNTNLNRLLLVHFKEVIQVMQLLPSFELANIKRGVNTVTLDTAKFSLSCKYDGLLVGVVLSCMMVVIGNYCMNTT